MDVPGIKGFRCQRKPDDSGMARAGTQKVNRPKKIVNVPGSPQIKKVGFS